MAFQDRRRGKEDRAFKKKKNRRFPRKFSLVAINVINLILIRRRVCRKHANPQQFAAAFVFLRSTSFTGEFNIIFLPDDLPLA